jgi:glycosyltransferase involved in cell wall biosynthesis
VLARLTTRLLTVSEASRGFLARLVGLPPSRIKVIPNGVDTQSFAPPAKRAANAPLVVGTAGSLTAVKNHALLLRAVANLHRAGIEARLLIAGEGPLRRDLERLIETQGATSRVRLLGHVHSMPDFLRSLDLFVLPSDSEAHPNALTEAMACGRACIATRVGGVAEITDDGRAAVLVDRGDEQGLTDALARLLTKDALRETLGHRAASLARERYSMSRMLESYRDLYCSLS